MKGINDTGVHEVVLCCDNMINVNETLVNEGYAARTTADDASLGERSLCGEVRLDSQSLMERRLNEKEKKKQELREKAAKEQRDVHQLLGLLNSPVVNSPEKPQRAPAADSPDKPQNPQRARTEKRATSNAESSDTSDFSDVEKSPAPPMTNYKQARPKLNNSQAVEQKLGKESVSYLQSRLDGVDLNEKKPTTTTSKTVSFTPDVEEKPPQKDEKEKANTITPG